jgi:uncharacterized protein YecT (DUF1311 family)
MVRLVAFLLAISFATMSQAQPGPEAECPPATSSPPAKPPRTTRATPCTDPDLDRAEIRLALAHADLAASLEPPARAHLQADQRRWQAARAELCLPPASAGAAEDVPFLKQCLLDLLRARTARIAALPRGAEYPFVSEHHRVATGPQFDAAASWLRIDRPGLLPILLSNEFELRATALMHFEDAGRWSVRLSHRLAFPAPGLLTVEYTWWYATDDLPEVTEQWARLVDLRTLSLPWAEDVFRRGTAWDAAVGALVTAELRRRDERGALALHDGGPLARKVMAVLADSGNWVFGEQGVEILFGLTTVASRDDGIVRIPIPYDTLRPFLNEKWQFGQAAH